MNRSALPATAAMLAALLLGCGGGETASTNDTRQALRDALTFHASFDGGAEADVAKGDPAVYSAASWGAREDASAGLPAGGLATIAEGEGIRGDALRFTSASPSIAFFEAADNVSFTSEDWSGTISFWLRLDPDNDLEPGYVDPIQISPRNWNDAALFVDFTRDDDPRHFRFAAFADRDVWDPEHLSWEDVAYEDRPMVEVSDPLPFTADSWTHVVMTFEHFNTGEANGVVHTYLNGEHQGTLDGREQTFTWDPEEAIIAIGLDYVGLFDELSLFNRALTEQEVAALYQLQGNLTAQP